MWENPDSCPRLFQSQKYLLTTSVTRCIIEWGWVVNNEWFYTVAGVFCWDSGSTASGTSSLLIVLCDLGQIILFLWPCSSLSALSLKSEGCTREKSSGLSQHLQYLIQFQKLYNSEWKLSAFQELNSPWETQKKDVNNWVGIWEDVIWHRCHRDKSVCKWLGRMITVSEALERFLLTAMFSCSQSKIAAV